MYVYIYIYIYVVCAPPPLFGFDGRHPSTLARSHDESSCICYPFSSHVQIES